ncbi:Na+/H+ antiporter NhaC [Amphibacillus marinus]|uniref:Na+/H+ antiporter NhaC n=1 Tax=Amphibacillus marinus TaxID=872970 RepID=A0A1H8RZ33_9BACI|nr:Na+/H+ antiporter NhaC family protein [Amphibacillus marinus]SEO71536.1 Na+/H+ antiporter NhaC [Amphibacillus marinus]
MIGTAYSLIPALLMLVLVIVTRKIYLSLGLGIVVGAAMLQNFNPINTLGQIWTVFRDIFYIPGEGINRGSLFLLAFLILLGILTAAMTASGGSLAFGKWAATHVKSRRGAQLVPVFLGLLIFIDDYFNALAVGQVARPLTDQQRVSRAKLAYIIDSTSAPITVISPISSWGAYIIGVIGAIFATNQIVNYQPLEAFIRMIPLNFYAFSSIFLVFVVALFNLNLGAMKKHEERAEKEALVYDPDKESMGGDLTESLPAHKDGQLYHLLVPILTLIVATIIAMLWTGYLETEGAVTIFSMFANTDVNFSLFLGGLIAVMVAFLLFNKQAQPKVSMLTIASKGFQSMLPALLILFLAWMIGDIIGALDTGGFLALLVEQAAFNPNYLPLVLFVVAGFMALATGTSWGTFGIMLPIAAQAAFAIDVTLVLPAMSAVLAGSVFGDHCSPISDTTILSSTGAGANHIDHVITQLPYAFICAIASMLGYFVYALFPVTIVALAVTLVLTIAISLMGLLIKNKL